jgi:hypothetical protein
MHQAPAHTAGTANAPPAMRLQQACSELWVEHSHASTSMKGETVSRNSCTEYGATVVAVNAPKWGAHPNHLGYLGRCYVDLLLVHSLTPGDIG